MQAGQVACWKTFVLRGEKADDESLARRMAAVCDVFVMDALVPPIGRKRPRMASRSARQGMRGTAARQQELKAFQQALQQVLRHRWSPSSAAPGYQQN